MLIAAASFPAPAAAVFGIDRRTLGNFKLVRCKIRKTKFGREAEKKLFGRQAEFFLEVQDLIRKIMHLTRKIIIEGANKSYHTSPRKKILCRYSKTVVIRADKSRARSLKRALLSFSFLRFLLRSFQFFSTVFDVWFIIWFLLLSFRRRYLESLEALFAGQLQPPLFILA